jgi:NDP-sugar pyrophosphorylase family protein
MIAASDVQAVILCGGRGTRLQSVVGDRPKALAEVAGRPFLDWMLESLREQGIREFVLCTGFGEAAVREYVRERAGSGESIVFSHEPAPLGTGGAVRHALGYLRSDPVLVLNADSWCRYGLQEFLSFHEEKRGSGSMLLAQVEDRSRYGSVELDGDSRITAFREKNSLSGAGWINAGVYALSPESIAEMPVGRAVSLETEFFPALLGRGLYGYRGGSDFIDIGTPESFVAAQELFARSGGAKVSRPVVTFNC